MGFSVLRRVLEKGFCRSGAGLLASRTHCSFVGRIPEKEATVLGSKPAPWVILSDRSDESGNVALRFHRLGNSNKVEPIISCQKLKLKLALPEKEKMYFAGSSHGWLFVHSLSNHDAFMLNPMTGGRINLPSVSTEAGVSRVALSCSPDHPDCRAVIIFGDETRLAFCTPGISNEWTPISGGDYRDYDDVVYSSTHKLFLCLFTSRRESSTGVESWDITDPLSPRIDWRLRHHDQLLFEWYDYPWPTGINDYDSLKKQASCRLKYLIVYGDGDHLFVVVRHIVPQVPISNVVHCAKVPYVDGSSYREWKHEDYSLPYKTVDFDVYRIVGWRERGDVTYMKCSLEGLAMFVGSNHSFAVSASEYPELKPNSIYFSDENRLMLASAGKGFGGHDNGIFDYQNNDFTSCCDDDDCPLNSVDYEEEDVKRIEPTPLLFAPSTLTH